MPDINNSLFLQGGSRISAVLSYYYRLGHRSALQYLISHLEIWRQAGWMMEVCAASAFFFFFFLSDTLQIPRALTSIAQPGAVHSEGITILRGTPSSPVVVSASHPPWRPDTTLCRRDLGRILTLEVNRPEDKQPS